MCMLSILWFIFFFFQAEDGIRDRTVTGVQTCALPIYEGAIATSGSILLVVPRPVRIVNGLYANLARGAALPDPRDIFWDSPRFEQAWSAPGRHFLISAVDPARSVVRALPPSAVHLIAEAGGRRLYSNLVDQGSEVR